MLKIEIDTGNAAYRDDYEVDENGDNVLDSSAAELERNLLEIIKKIEYGYTEGNVFDINGNKSGKWSLD